MKYSDFFKNKEIKILTIIFIILSFIHIIYASVVGRGLFIDGMWWVPHILNSLDENGYGFYLFDDRSRVFVKFISQLPMNIAYYLPFIGKNKDALIFFFSLPLFLFPFLITMFNLILAKRSKRYDLVFAALFLYAFSILPSIMYAVVEAFIATSFLLLLWHYFVADIDYNWKDICAIVFLCIFSFSSTELVIPFGILIFLLSLKKIKFPLRDKNSVVRLFISITQLCASFVTFYMYMFVYEGIKEETLLFFNELNFYHPNGIDKMFYLEPFLVETVTLVVLIACFFLKTKIKYVAVSLLTTIYLSIFIFMLCHRELYFYNYVSISYRCILYIVFTLIVLILCLQEIYRKYFHKNLLHNFIIVILFCGICNTFIQLFYSYKTNDLFERFNDIVEETKEVFIKPEDKLLMKVYNAQDNLFLIPLCPIADFICLTDDYKIDQIVLPFSKYAGNNSPTCFNKFVFNQGGDFMGIYYTTLNVRTHFWDLSLIEKEFQKNRKKFKKYDVN